MDSSCKDDSILTWTSEEEYGNWFTYYLRAQVKQVLLTESVQAIDISPKYLMSLFESRHALLTQSCASRRLIIKHPSGCIILCRREDSNITCSVHLLDTFVSQKVFESSLEQSNLLAPSAVKNRLEAVYFVSTGGLEPPTPTL